jgi:uncharacterized membrane protein YraQ (UPF0718 family)
MMGWLAVGGPGPGSVPTWDFWLPAYMLLSFLLIVVFLRIRITPWIALACFAAGTLWSWLDNAIGVLPAGAVAVLVAVASGALLPRITPFGRSR